MCSPMARRSSSSTSAMTSLRSRASGRIASRLANASNWRVGGCPLDCLLDVYHVGAGLVPALVTAGFGSLGDSVGDERDVTEDDREQVVEVVRHAASGLAQGLHALDLLHLGVQSFVLRKGFAALAVAPRVEQVLSVAAFAVLCRLGLVLGVAGVAALGAGLHVDPLLGIPGVLALGVGLHVGPLLGVPGAAALGIGLLLKGVAAFAIDRHLGLILSGPLPGDLP